MDVAPVLVSADGPARRRQRRFRGSEGLPVIHHPLLLDPERRRAFEDLLATPSGTERTWAARWGWSRAKVRRFVAALERHQLADLTRTEFGTAVRIRPTPGPQPAHPPLHQTGPRAVQDRPTPGPCPAHLVSSSRLTDLVSRSAETETYEVELIRALNRFGRIRFGDEFDDISDDNRSSLAAARSLRDSGFDLDVVVDELRKAVTLFNPSKHGRGNLPGSLAYFEKGLRKALSARAANDAREQSEMVLLATIEGEAGARSPGKPEPIAAVIGTIARQVGGR